MTAANKVPKPPCVACSLPPDCPARPMRRRMFRRANSSPPCQKTSRAVDRSAFVAELEELMIEELLASGANIRAKVQRCSDGKRGLFATEDLEADEHAIWVPADVVLNVENGHGKIRESVRLMLGGAHGSKYNTTAEGDAMAASIALTATYLHERSKGTASKFYSYLESMPDQPPMINTFSEEERELAYLMLGTDDHDGHAVWEKNQTNVDLCLEAIRSVSWLWGGQMLPNRDEVESAHYFVTSKMSNRSLIPLIDLVNAAIPGNENCRILSPGQQEAPEEGPPPPPGFSLTTVSPVKCGDELVLNYYCNDGVRMLCQYGCNMGFETCRSVTRIRLPVPEHLQMMGFGIYATHGAQLCESEGDLCLDAQTLACLRMSAFGQDAADFTAACKAGFFETPRRAPSNRKDREQFQRWTDMESEAFGEVERMVCAALTRWEREVTPAMANFNKLSVVGSVFAMQHETEVRVLRRCARALRAQNRAGTAAEEDEDEEFVIVDGVASAEE